jgi:putative spermidine/putrescine transport system ATP-binding protein
MAMVFQDLALWPNLTALENVVLGLAGSDLPSEERGRRATEALEACGISDLARRRPDALSGGQQQRVALARALAVRPKVLLLDEPFSGLDLTIKTRLQTQMQELCAAFKLTLILVAHDPLEARALCHQAAVLENGAIQETGPLDDLLANPESITLRTFVEQLRDTGKKLGTK